MSVEIKFKKSQESVVEYLVSIDGFPAVSTGEGADGRAAAYGMLKFYGLAKEARKRWRGILDHLFSLASGDASLEFARKDAGVFISATVDGERLYCGTDAADLELTLSRTVKPSTDHPTLGY